MIRSRFYVNKYRLKNFLLLESKCYFSKTNGVLRSSSLDEQLKINNEDQNDIRFNEIGIQMISEEWRSILFGKKRAHNEELVNEIRKNLEKFGLNTNPTSNFQQIPCDLKIPKLFGRNLDEHFKLIAGKQSDKYVRMISDLITSEMPLMPTKWSFKQGWTKYDSNHLDGIQIDNPSDEALVFDVEVLVSHGNLPTMAVAVSNTCWYSWCSNTLIHDVFHHASIFDELISFEKTDKYGNRLFDNERIVICHNAGFDRSFIKEQYLPNRGKLNFLDTMCLHIACSGLTSEQRALKNSQKTNDENEIKLIKKEKRFENFNSQPVRILFDLKLSQTFE
jgi:DNA polymerase gamma 1